MGKYDGTCLTCDKLQVSDYYGSSNINGSRRQIYCSHHGFVNPWDRKCSSYENAYRSDEYIKRCLAALDKKANYYIVSTTCDLLNLGRDSIYIEVFDKFNDYLRSTRDGEKLMAEYDVYGKIVANIIRENYNTNDKRKETYNLLMDVIKPTLDIIVTECNAQRSILRYIILTRKLMELYNVPYKEIEFDIDNNKRKSFIYDKLETYRGR